jgi:circadian clock protein KaiB
MEAITNLRAICAECLRGSYQIEIVDVLKQKRRALDDGVMITPLLMKLSPEPVSRVVGSLSNRESLLQALGMPARNP